MIDSHSDTIDEILNYPEYYETHMNKALYSHDIQVGQIAKAVNPELHYQYEKIEHIFRQQWIILSDEPGIEEWERILSITPDLASDDLEDRRERIHRIYNMRPSFALGWLAKWLQEEYDEPTLIQWSPITLDLMLWVHTPDNDIAIDLRRQLIQLIPCNVNVLVYKQIPFLPIDHAIGTLFASVHNMSMHYGIGAESPKIDSPIAIGTLFATTANMSKHYGIGMAPAELTNDMFHNDAFGYQYAFCINENGKIYEMQFI